MEEETEPMLMEEEAEESNEEVIMKDRASVEREVALLLAKNKRLKFDAEPCEAIKKMKNLTDDQLQELLFNLELQSQLITADETGVAAASALGTILDKTFNTKHYSLKEKFSEDADIYAYLGEMVSKVLPIGGGFSRFLFKVGMYVQAALFAKTKES